MHFEILVEGTSDKTSLWNLLKKILGERGNPHTWSIHKHRGKGEIPNDLSAPPNPKDDTLLHNLYAKLQVYGETMDENQAVIVLVDLDDIKDCRTFKQQLNNLLTSCREKPKCLFRIAIEEMEAWYIGDQNAIKAAYPKVKTNAFDKYVQDSQCGTWEILADAIYPGGRKALKSGHKRYYLPLEQKVEWAAKITPEMNVEINASPSFQCFRDGLRKLASQS